LGNRVKQYKPYVHWADQREIVQIHGTRGQRSRKRFDGIRFRKTVSYKDSTHSTQELQGNPGLPPGDSELECTRQQWRQFNITLSGIEGQRDEMGDRIKQYKPYVHWADQRKIVHIQGTRGQQYRQQDDSKRFRKTVSYKDSTHRTQEPQDNPG